MGTHRWEEDEEVVKWEERGVKIGKGREKENRENKRRTGMRKKGIWWGGRDSAPLYKALGTVAKTMPGLLF